MRQKLIDIWSKYKVTITGIVIIIAVYLTLSLLGITVCPLKAFFGISCPGCGMSRACLSALRLDLASAFDYHPLWIMLPVVAVCVFYFTIKKKKTACYVTVGVFVFALLAVYFYRLLFTDSAVVSFSPESGVVYRVIERMLG